MTTIIELIDTALRKFPHNTITANGETITYVELGKRIEHRVKRLAELGVKANMPVGVAAVTSVDMIINALAVIKAKAILAPLGFVKRTNPAQRLKNIITDSQLKIMIGAEALPAHFPKDVGVQHIKDSDLTKPTSAEHKQYADEKAPITPDSIYAYYFSSGSEGPPKGVKCTHSGIPKWQDTWTKTLGMQPGDNIAIHPRLTFDAGIWDLFRGLATGANIFWLPDDPTAEEIVDFINKNNITHITLHPSIIPLIDPASIKHPVKFVSTGDKFSAQIIQKFLESGHKLFNGYGPTESGVGATLTEITDAHLKCDRIPIGQPLTGMEFFFRDLKTKQLYTFDNVPQNTDVEICIGGLGITPGYLNNPELMSANFIAHPKDPKQKLFVPGDVVTLDKGMIYYVKRLSNFVKIAGQHVSPTEVETVTARLGFPDKPKFAQVAVTSFEYKHCSDNQLVCYYTLNSGETITLSGLRTHLAQLPAYSIPSLFVPLRKLPVGTNDKIARDQLPPPHALTEILRDDKPTEPTSALEAQLRKICAALIGINETLIGVKDHLSDVGLTSLLALSLITILKRDEKNGGYNVKISSQELIKHPTIEKLASLIQAKKATAAINEINSTGTAPAIWVVHDITGKTDYFRPTALLGERQIFGLDATPCGESLEAMAHAQIAAMRSKQPRGPYHIVAYSSGTALAKTIALILENQEEIIASLTFLDAPAPTVLKAQSTADYATHLHSVVEKLLVILQYKYNQYLITLPSIDDTKKQDTHANQIKFLFGHLKIRKTESNEKQSEKEPTELLVKQEADLLNDLNIIKNIFLAMEGEEPLKGQKLKCKITLFYTDALSQQYPTFEPHFGWDESCPQMDHRKIPKSDHATIVSAADQIGEWQKRISELTYEAYSPNTSDFSKLVTTLSSQLDQLSSAAKLANDHGSSSAADAGSVNDTKSSFDSTSNAIAEKLEAMREMLRNFQTTRLGASGVKPKHLASGSTLPTSPRSSPGFRLPFFVSVDAKSSAASAAGAAAAASAAAVPHSMSAPVTPMAPPGTDVADAGGGVSPRVSSALPTSQSGPIIFNLPPVSTAGSIPALAPKTGAGAVPDPAAAAAAAALESMQPLAPPLPPPSFTGPT